MKRLQIHIEEELDEALAAEAAARATSKAALIRGYVADNLRHRLGRRHDPLDELVGRYDEDPGDIDAVVYGS
jgi:hypothetical protein